MLTLSKKERVLFELSGTLLLDEESIYTVPVILDTLVYLERIWHTRTEKSSLVGEDMYYVVKETKINYGDKTITVPVSERWINGHFFNHYLYGRILPLECTWAKMDIDGLPF